MGAHESRLPSSPQLGGRIIKSYWGGRLAGNYGEAGAIDFFGAKYGLPKAISGHNNYYLWGTRGYTGEVVILFGQHAESTKTMFGTVEQVASISNWHDVAAENHLPVYICRRPKVPLAKLWPTLRYFE